MRDGGRLSAAIEILTDVETRHRPVKLALKAWGDASRFAGSKDRAWVSGLVLDVLRRRRSLGWRMGDDSARAATLCALHPIAYVLNVPYLRTLVWSVGFAGTLAVVAAIFL